MQARSSECTSGTLLFRRLLLQQRPLKNRGMSASTLHSLAFAPEALLTTRYFHRTQERLLYHLHCCWRFRSLFQGSDADGLLKNPSCEMTVV